jgi:polysaccharide biosynthesis protein PslF
VKKVSYTKILKAKEEPIRAIYISSYIPEKCGIATFTKDLTSTINVLNPDYPAEIVAVHDDDLELDYPWEVKFKISQTNLENYHYASNYINQSSADIVNLQHEFGLFGGVDGDYILPMLDSLNKPIVTNFHTIQPEPTEHQKYIMKRIINKSEAVIAMTNISKKILKDVYGCPERKAVVIYHGVPDFTFNDKHRYRKLLKIKSDHVLLMSGLLGPDKGIDYVIEAMPAILRKFPDTKFYVLGETHPNLIKDKKDEYREKLERMVKKLKLEDSVVFINKYLTLDELVKYYKAADVFFTPHLNPQQPTSGTLSYALGAGKVCISTPYNYAKEVLDNDNGILIPFRDSKSISEAVTDVFSDPGLKLKYEKNAYRLGKQMQWPRVAQSYLNLFRAVLNKKQNENTEI